MAINETHDPTLESWVKSANFTDTDFPIQNLALGVFIRPDKDELPSIGMAIGELQFLPLRPFSRSHLGIIGDAINMASRLSSSAQSDEIVVSNSLRTQFPFATQQLLREIEPVEAKNVGRIKAWRFSNGAATSPPQPAGKG